VRDETAQGFVVLTTGRAALQVLADPAQARVGVVAGKLDVDVLVEEFEHSSQRRSDSSPRVAVVFDCLDDVR
jgi:hypothetical protein